MYSMLRLKKKLNEHTTSGIVILWEERDSSFLLGQPNYNHAPVIYPCCGRRVIQHNSSFTDHRKIPNRKCDACRKQTQVKEAHPNWKGGIYIHRGYRHIHVDTLPLEQRPIAEPMIVWGKYIPEHRLVYALSLGRPLKRSEQIHHKNGIKSDNRPENLLLLGASEHASEHWRVEKALAEALKKISELEYQISILSQRLIPVEEAA